MASGIPKSKQITTEWINQLLRRNGYGGEGDSFDAVPIGTGQLAESLRFTLQRAGGAADGAPLSIVGKFPSSDENSRTTCRALNLYRNEVLFYKELAPRSRIYVPPVLTAEFDHDTHDFLIVFEDLSSSRAGNQLEGMSVAEGCEALREVARLHASSWDDVHLRQLSWLSVPETAQDFYTTELLEQAWREFDSYFGQRMDPQVRDVCSRFVSAHRKWNVALPTPKCLTHCDFRADNLLVDGASGRIATVDWQTVNMLSAGMDAAYFVGGSILPDDRRAHEQELLDVYFSELIDCGVRDYSFDQFYRDYRHYSFAGLTVAIAGLILTKRTTRGEEMFFTMVDRHARHVIDLDAIQLLGT